MKAKELLELSVEELLAKQRDMREEIFKLNLQKHGGQIEKPSRIGELRKDIARIETVLTQKRRAGATVPAAATATPTEAKQD